jgi:hypothetical protein
MLALLWGKDMVVVRFKKKDTVVVLRASRDWGDRGKASYLSAGHDEMFTVEAIESCRPIVGDRSRFLCIYSAEPNRRALSPREWHQ